MNIIFNQEDHLDSSKNTIFLAGPTSRVNTSNSWRKDAIKILEELNFTGNVVVPEPRDNFINNETFNKTEQILWERKYLSIANIIMFWIPRDTTDLPGFTTNIEFGEWCNSGKSVLGYPPGTEKMDYIDFLYHRYTNLIPEISLEKTIGLCIDKLSRPSKTWFTSDTHFGQLRTLELSKRPFVNTEEMDLTIISNWNSLVYCNDIVHHLGDFGNPESLKYLSGKMINLIIGNYDNQTFLDNLKLLDSLKRVNVWSSPVYKYGDLTLIHEPLNGTSKNEFYLYGHIHQLQMVKRNGLNVGCDCHKFKPIDLDTVYFYKNAIEKYYDENVFVDTITDNSSQS